MTRCSRIPEGCHHRYSRSLVKPHPLLKALRWNPSGPPRDWGQVEHHEDRDLESQQHAQDAGAQLTAR
jgi:hypothetical protein